MKKHSYTLGIDLNAVMGPLVIRNYALGQAGVDDMPFTKEVIQKLKLLKPSLIRLFVQEYFKMMQSPGRYTWKRIDPVLKSIKKIGAKPFLALCMKPKCLYQKIDQTITKPKNWKQWSNFISTFVRHVVQDLGLQGIWYEVGNEPDLGEQGGCPYLFTSKDYAEYYMHTVKAITKSDPEAKIGGPVLAVLPQESPFPKVLAKVIKKEKLPLDFFSWHVYHPDPKVISSTVPATKAVLKKLGEPFASAKTVLGEWNITYNCSIQVGEFIQSAFLVDTVARCIDAGLDYSFYYHIMDMDFHYSKWKSWFSKAGLERITKGWRPSHKGLHMLTPEGGTLGPYTAFRMLYAMEGMRLRAKRISDSLGVLASRKERSCRVLLWNYHDGQAVTEKVRVKLGRLPAKKYTEAQYCLGADLLDTEAI